jgi:four helix bundle protein
MSSYEDLDAFKACHQLTMAAHRVSEKVEERDVELAGQLWAAALIASSRIARGSGFRHRRMFAVCVDRTLGALSEISYHLEMGRTLGLISKADHRELESLGGRALFYVMKLAMSLGPDPTGGSAPPTS